jgi:SAM-dependent methyltransferase
MTTEPDIPTTERLARLLDHLGIERAHLAGAGQAVPFAAAYPEAVVSLALFSPMALAIDPLRSLASGHSMLPPLLVIHGDQGGLASIAERAVAVYPGATDVALHNYAGLLWSDLLADRASEVAPTLLPFLTEASEQAGLEPVHLTDSEGEVAGISYRVQGSGPPLLLFPLHLAPSQWDPLLPTLAERYCTVTLGGAFLGMVYILESRARTKYLRVVSTLVDALAPRPGEAVVEVGCGSGALVRWLARRTAGANPIVGLDVNRYLLREAAALARREGVADRIEFREGNAERLPFSDATFDVVFSSTVMEEVDADRMLAELVRVTKPGGRIGVIVRAEDIPFWDSLPLRPALRAKVAARRGAGAGERGCADASLYRRFAAAGLTHLEMGPQFGGDRLDASLPDRHAGFQAGSLDVLTEAEAAEWRTAAVQAERDGAYLWADGYHCAVGTKP